MISKCVRTVMLQNAKEKEKERAHRGAIQRFCDIVRYTGENSSRLHAEVRIVVRKMISKRHLVSSLWIEMEGSFAAEVSKDSLLRR